MRGALNIAHIYVMGRFSYTRYHRFSTLLFARFMRFSYQDFVGKNSAVLSQSIFSYTGTLTQLIFAMLTLMAEIFTVLCIYGMLFFVNWKMTIILSCFLSIKSFFLLKIFSKSISQSGKRTQYYALEGSKILNESIGNFKLIKLGGYEKATTERVATSTQGYASAQIVYVTLQNTPRFLLETIGFLLLVAIILYVIYLHNNASFVIPIVSLYALAFYRLLPSLNKILASINQITFSHHALQGVYDFLQLPTESLGKYDLMFGKTIQLNNLSFGYVPNKLVLHNVSMTVQKGEHIAFIGPSGSGKSTLVDVMMGLYTPNSGTVLIDGIHLDDDRRAAWRRKIGYIPQSIYLVDGTVAQNIVFGRSYDENKIITVLQKAHMYYFLMTQQGIHTRVGEGGIKLSGGQKQRIAIARALYTDPEVLVLDEATSALDYDTESNIMDEIYEVGSKVTLIIIAHRTTTVARCNTIYKIDNGAVHQVLASDVIQKQPTST
jgi:ATP-binding cassette, subfamily B, bacterial PglK